MKYPGDEREFPETSRVMLVPVELDKPVTVFEIPSDGPKSSDILRELVGGWIEKPASVEDVFEVVANEESRLLELGVNTRANKMLGPAAEEYDPNPRIESMKADGTVEITPLPKPPGGLGLIHGPAVFTGPVIEITNDETETWVTLPLHPALTSLFAALIHEEFVVGEDRVS